jgi:hypothetical protein
MEKELKHLVCMDCGTLFLHRRIKIYCDNCNGYKGFVRRKHEQDLEWIKKDKLRKENSIIRRNIIKIKRVKLTEEEKEKHKKEYYKEYYKNHKEIYNIIYASYRKKYRENHKEYYKEYNKKYKRKDSKEYNKLYRLSKKVINYKKHCERLKTDLNYKLKYKLRICVRQYITKEYKTTKTMDLLGCTVNEFRNYLEGKFTKGMSWQNYGRNGWVIDHIVPCSKFDLTDIEQQRQCFHYRNMQPLWEKNNRIKSDKLIQPQLKLLL